MDSHLEGVHIAESVLHVAVNDEFGETQHLATQMEGIAKPRLLPLLQSNSAKHYNTI